MTPRVLHVINTLDHGGSEHYIVRLAHLLPPDRVRFWIVYGEGLGSLLRHALPSHVGQIQVPRLDVRQARGWGEILTIRRAIREHKIDVVHTWLTSSAVLGWIAAGLARIPVVFTPGGPLRTRSTLEGVSARLGLSRRLLPRLIHTWVALGPFVRDELIEVVGIPGSRIATVPHGVDVDRFRPSPARPELRRVWGFSQEDRVLCTIGSFRPVKGIPKAIHLLAELRQLAPSARLVVVGDGRLRTEFEALIARLGIGEHVRLLGNRDDIPDVLAAADAYLLTVDAPLLGTATLEAMACGKPIVAFARDSVERRMAAEAVVEEGNGLIVSVDPKEAAPRVAELLADDKRLHDMGAQSRRLVVQHFDFRRAGQLHEELYERLAREAAAP